MTGNLQEDQMRTDNTLWLLYFPPIPLLLIVQNDLAYKHRISTSETTPDKFLLRQPCSQYSYSHNYPHFYSALLVL